VDVFEVFLSIFDLLSKRILFRRPLADEGGGIAIKGHTSLDDLPDGATEQQKMDLSLRRAQAAADYLVSKGVEADIIRVQGCSTFEPLTQHQYTVDAQTLNRRVEVEATNTLIDDLQDKPRNSDGATSAPSDQ
jgi:flagellar motor protein MotB